MEIKTIFFRFLFLCIVYFHFSSCHWKVPNEGFKIENGIVLEKLDSLNRDENRFNTDNTIYTVGRTFIYDYAYKKLGIAYKIKLEDEDWKLVETKNKSQNDVLDKITIKVMPGLEPFSRFDPNYSQTVISYGFLPSGFFSKTGVVENKHNIWLHPPREYLFRILELNPFPYIKKPLKKGSKWKWSLTVGESWGDTRWKKWKGKLFIDYEYEIVGKEIIETQLGRLNCHIVRSEATSRLGSTKLISYFNEFYGFVKLEYTNIDQSQITLNIITAE